MAGVSVERVRPFAWWREAPRPARRALFAASLGWMLDSFDVMLYSLVLASLMLDLHLSKGTAGLLGSITLAAAAAGGLAFGIIADRFGRTRALMASVLIYAVFTAACGFAHSFVQLAVFRILLGFGMGGEVGERSVAGVGDVAGGASRQGAWVYAELVGDWVCAGSAGGGCRDAMGVGGGRFSSSASFRPSSRFGFAVMSKSPPPGLPRTPNPVSPAAPHFSRALRSCFAGRYCR